MSKLRKLIEQEELLVSKETLLLEPSVFDRAIVGTTLDNTTNTYRFIYQAESVIECIQALLNSSYDEAVYYYNSVINTYTKCQGAPIFLERILE